MIRKAKINDLDAIMSIVQETVIEMKNNNNLQWNEEYPLEKDFIRDIKEETLYVKEVQNEILGFICINTVEAKEYKELEWSTKEDKSIIIHRLAIKLNARKKGIGSELVFFADKFAIEKGIFSLKSDTGINNINMSILFKKCGYNIVGEVYFSGIKDSFVCYEKNLSNVTLEELFHVGINFETFVGTGLRSERDRIVKNYSRTSIPKDLIEEISNTTNKINFLVVGEMWCPDVQLNVTTVKKIIDMNTNFNMKIITKGRGEKYLSSILGIYNFKVPTILILNEKFNILGVFIERNKIVKEKNFKDIKIQYLKGEFIEETIREIASFILKI
ncbi:MAG: GNAT family N-acetyltransferase [Fusobacteriaceae bacterium]